MNSSGEGLACTAWEPQPAAAAIVNRLVERFCEICPELVQLRQRMLQQTGTRLVDWVDHFVVHADQALERELSEAGFAARPNDRSVWEHSRGLFPVIRTEARGAERIAIQVESVAQFMMVHAADRSTAIEGPPLSPFRTSKVAGNSEAEFWVVERHGCRDFQPIDVTAHQPQVVLRHQERFVTRQRSFDDDAEGFEQAQRLIAESTDELGTDWTCALFFAAERQYWQSRNRAARIQKARQDALGLGWANHDHHTYRSSREHFTRLIELLERLGFVCRERFYGGREAGWGAQVLEQSLCGIIVFADVDLTPDEVTGDFAHQGLGPVQQLGTVGLWCKLHGEAILEAGMHHLECQFAFDPARQQLAAEGVDTMAPFTDLAYLKQAFTAGEVWPVSDRRIDAALAAGLIDQDQAERFRHSGSIGSHLEILQRDDGFKGFNQSGISEIIRDTDPRRAKIQAWQST